MELKFNFCITLVLLLASALLHSSIALKGVILISWLNSFTYHRFFRSSLGQ